MTQVIELTIAAAPPPVSMSIPDVTGRPLSFTISTPAAVGVEVGGEAGPPGRPGNTGVVSAEDPLLYDPDAQSLAVALATDAGFGVVRLAGDLAGTADAPTVPGLASKAAATDLAALATVVGGKADTTVVTSLTGTVGGLTTGLATETSDRVTGDNALAADIAAAADSAAVTAAQLADADTALGGRIDTEIADRVAAVAGVQSNVDAVTATIGTLATISALDLETQARQQAITALTSSTTTALAGKADLVGGTVPTSQMPDMGGLRAHVVANQAGMLALTGLVAGEDAAFLSDTGAAYIYRGGSPSNLANWLDFSLPNAISLINGQHGPTVTLGYADVGADPTGAADAARAAAITAAAADATTKANTARSDAITAAEAYTDTTTIPRSWLAQQTAGAVTGVATLDAAGLLLTGQRPYATNVPVGLSTQAARGTGAGFAQEGHTHPSTVTVASAADVALLITGAASQSGSLLRVQNSALASMLTVDSAGVLTTPNVANVVGLNSSWYVSGLTLNAAQTDPAGTVVFGKGAASQTANLFALQNSATTNMLTVTPGGTLTVASALVGATGAITNALTTRTLTATGTAVGDIPITTKVAASATGRSFRMLNSANAELFALSQFGEPLIGGNTPLTFLSDNSTGGSVGGFDPSMMKLGTLGRVQSFAGATGTYLANGAYYDGANWLGISTATSPSYISLVNGVFNVFSAAAPATNGAAVTPANLFSVAASGAVSNRLAATNAVGLLTTLAASATGDAYQLKNSGTTTIAGISAAGRIWSGSTGPLANAAHSLVGSGTGNTVLTLRAVSGVTAPVLQVQTSAPAVVANIFADGGLTSGPSIVGTTGAVGPRLELAATTTAPTSNPVGGAIIYLDANGHLQARTPNGLTQLAA